MRQPTRRLSRDRRAVAAVEFAILAPVMVMLFFGVVELSNVLRAQAKLNAAAAQYVEMIAAQSGVTEGSAEGPGGTLGDFCTGASYNMLPFSPTPLVGYVGSTTVVQGWGGLQTTTDWANDTSCPSSNKYGSFWETINLSQVANTPQSLFTADGTPSGSGGALVLGYTAISVILNYQYSNVASYFLGQTFSLTATAAARPRTNVPIPCTFVTGSTSSACPSVY